MNGLLTFTAGFVTGWLARSTASSSRDAAVGLIAFGLELGQRAKRAVDQEHERLQALAAEARSRLDRIRAKRATNTNQRVDSAA
jgi:hypothetical protein